jgi:hypothetical protein
MVYDCYQNLNPGKRVKCNETKQGALIDLSVNYILICFSKMKNVRSE